MTLWRYHLRTDKTRRASFVRLLVALVAFVPEGLQKFLLPESLGAGRFAMSSISAADFMDPFVGVVDTLCGLLIILGLFTGLAMIPPLVVTAVADIANKLPILIGRDIGPFHFATDIGQIGVWSSQHGARADLTMFLSLLFLLIVGAEEWPLDASLSRRGGKASSPVRSQ